MSTAVIISALFCVLAGGIVLYAKPRRLTNQTFFVTSCLAGLWLYCVWRMIQLTPENLPIADIAFWLRLNGTTSVLLGGGVWVLSVSVITPPNDVGQMIRQSITCLAFLGLLSSVCFSEAYVSRAASFDKGPLYFTLAALAHIFYAALILKSWRQMRQHIGIRRVETQFLSLNLAIALLLVVVLTTIGNIFNIGFLKRASIIVFVSAFALSAWAITFHRTYNAYQIFTSLAHRITIILLLSITTLMVLNVLNLIAFTRINILLSIAISCSGAFWVDRKSRRWFQLECEQELTSMRNAVIRMSRSESKQESLVSGFESVLRNAHGVTFAELVPDRDGRFVGNCVEFAHESTLFRALSDCGWATPEALTRRRTTCESDELHRFLLDRSIAAIVSVPRGSPTPSLLIALGEKNDGWPVTYPEIERLINIAELMDNVLLHARLAAEAALKARVEHLAMMSRGLAHDLKNLITPISSFLIHAEPRLTRGTVEAEVHDSASRSVAIINDYIGEALFFGTRLELRLESTAVPVLIQTVIDITASRAAKRRVTVVSKPMIQDQPHIDRVLVQRMLANLVNNAVDASAPGKTVTLSVIRIGADLQVTVADSGSGISAENRARIFEPYFTTKQMGDDARGFGLGLTICEKIVRLHGGTIRVDSEPGRGTTMTVELPSAFASVRPAAQ